MIQSDAALTGQNAGRRRPALVIAADVPDGEQALALAHVLSGLPLWFKVGLELFCAAGREPVRALIRMGIPLFLDLKFHDIPNTVERAVHAAALLGASMLTVHTAGGEAMCRAAVRGRRLFIEQRDADGALRRKWPRPVSESAPLLMGVTVLTSEKGDAGAIRAEVTKRARLARDCGLDGVVCSGHEAEAVKTACGPEFLCLCPGIRFADGRDADDQARVLDPRAAVAQGADFLVMGRPVTRAQDPRAAAMRALSEMYATR
ncbi:orotidine-5'-phosphate decarboxylase [Desulfovibrio sp. OttesenSCG-928-A18]|nr:orotidine-5'-phosphate decarboxylase [Desulfovibrio sp. OttesenSCG-928-A18]